VVNTITNAHGGASVSSVSFSKNGRYLLSAGQDSKPRVWDMNAGGKIVHLLEGTNHIVSVVDVVVSFT
jgi:WD40 repeat protein